MLTIRADDAGRPTPRSDNKSRSGGADYPQRELHRASSGNESLPGWQLHRVLTAHAMAPGAPSSGGQG